MQDELHDEPIWNNQTIAEQAKLWKVPIPDLLAQSPNDDPFYCGTPAHWKWAKWFLEAKHGTSTTLIPRLL